MIERGLLDGEGVEALRAATATVQSWPAGSHVWGHYAEQTDSGPAICRTENVSACHPSLADLVDGPLRSLAAEVAGCAMVAFKDKVNYKQPGGAGFAPHQDVVAYPGAGRVLSLLVAIDECSLESGCLWLASGIDERLPTDARGAVEPSVASGLSFAPAELAPGDVVCIDGYAPHYSEANRSAHERRVLVASYSPVSEGYSRSAYYAARRDVMSAASAQDGRFRISTLADFEGAEVTPDSVAVDACTHATVTGGGPSTRRASP